jgi:D-alanyl-D-alanine carboxypeptidase
MDQRDEWFSAEDIEEQMERSLSGPEQSRANARLLHDLQQLGADDVRRLSRIRERLAEHVADGVRHEPVPLQRLHSPAARSRYQAGQRRSGKRPQRLVNLLSGLVAVVVIGSMLGVLTLLRSHSEQGFTQRKGQEHQTPHKPTSTPVIHALAAFLLDAASGKVLVDVNGHTPLSIAATAQVMTAVVAIDDANLDQSVTIEQATLNEAPPGMRSAQLLAGDRIQLRDLLYGLLLPSGGDAALVIAHAVAGNTQNFVAMMNDEAHQLQLNDTHFSSPYSSGAPAGYSSAADLSRLGQYAMQLSPFARVVAAPSHVLPATPHNHLYKWQTTNALLLAYAGMNGINAGSDASAGACMLFSALRGGRLLIGAELHAPTEHILDSDVKKLLDRGFAA